MKRVLLLGVALALGAGCGSGGDGAVQTLSHDFEPVTVEPFGELSWECQSWTLGNEEPLWVNAVRARNDGFWHHSNWFFVPDTWFQGPDGTWPCPERGFEEITAGVAGGVLFAQSTQATEDVQQFAPGAAFRVPAQARVVGNIHLLNLSDQEITSGMDMDLDVIPEERVETELLPLAFFNRAIEIPPRMRSEFTMECSFDEPKNFNVHYVMPHYHDLGVQIRLELIGGERDGETIFQTEGQTGEAWGRSLQPPENLAGATGLRFTCVYDNPRDEVVTWGIGDQEMCVMLAYSDSVDKHAGFAGMGENVEVGVVDGVSLNEDPCDLQSFPPPPR